MIGLRPIHRGPRTALLLRVWWSFNQLLYIDPFFPQPFVNVRDEQSCL